MGKKSQTMIDLRSDTVTKPNHEMRELMAKAIVGDDVYGEDKTVNELQKQIADYFGKEEALFCPSGTMANQIGILLNSNSGDEIIIEGDAHLFYYETAAPAMISRIQFNTIKSERGEIPLDEIKKAIRPDVYYFPKTAAICLENTHNRHGGTVMSLEYVHKVREIAESNGLRMHLDGARLWNAITASGIEGKDWAENFNTLNVCMSKGLGAPVGSFIIGSKEDIQKAWRWRKILGGGMRQAGIIAAGAKYAFEHNFPRMGEDHKKAKTFAKGISEHKNVSIDLNTVETNMVAFKLDDSIDANKFVSDCLSNEIHLHHIENNVIRVVFHLDITQEAADKALNVMLDILDN